MACLRWHINNPDGGRLIAAYRHHGVEIPKGLEQPELKDVEHYYWQAFCDLSGDRQDGGSIPWTAIRRYWEVDGFGDFPALKKIIGVLDGVVIESRKRKEGG